MIKGTTIPVGRPGNKIIDRIREVYAAGDTTVSFEFFPAKVSAKNTPAGMGSRGNVRKPALPDHFRGVARLAALASVPSLYRVASSNVGRVMPSWSG
jgi:hypothetical protein